MSVKIKTHEDFKDKVLKEFMSTLQALLPCKVSSLTFPKDNYCLLKLLTMEGQKTFSLWRSTVDNTVYYCQGGIAKPQERVIN